MNGVDWHKGEHHSTLDIKVLCLGVDIQPFFGYLISILAIFLLNTGYSQKSIVRFENLTNNQGLSSNQVNCIFQDKKGFIWIGTDDGLNRFDGLNFTTYKHSIKNPASLSDSYIDAITQDDQGNLLIGTSKGISVFDWKSDAFTSLDFKMLPEPVANGNIEYLLKVKNAIWVAVEDQGLYRLSFEDETVSTYTTKDGLASMNIAFLKLDDQGRLWAIADGQLHYFAEDHFKAIRFPGLEVSVTAFSDGNDGTYWIGTDGSGLFKLTAQKIF